VLLVGLTGGIGSGKSTVARMLSQRGAEILDADSFARAAIEPGTPAFDRVVDRFGLSILAADGSIDRRRLAAVVFEDERSLRELEAIVHPEVRRMIGEAVADRAGTGAVVVIVNPLLIEMGTHRECDVVVVVSADPQTRVLRSVAAGMEERDVRARMAAQLPEQEKAALADVVVENDGTVEDLEREVDSLWSDLQARAAVG
jgi:dephospho-CoA kinase